MGSVYRKTEKGLAEIETRANRLVPRLRQALIMVDGRRSDDDLRKLILAQPDETLAALMEQGYIEIIATVAPRPAARNSGFSTSPGASTLPPGDSRPLGRGAFEDHRRQAVRFLTDQMGPSAESLALKLEKAHDWAELRPHLEMAEHFLRASRGPGTAKDFAGKFIESLP